MNLEALIRLRRTIRAVGFDDAPFVRQAREPVAVAGVVCAGTRFEGMVWTHVQPYGWDATATLAQTLLHSKFLPQVHVVLLDGIALGGFNVIDLPLLAKQVERPCVSVMRRLPHLDAIAEAMRHLPEPERRLEILKRAGRIHASPPFYFQVCGAEPSVIADVLQQLTDRGHVPEALRLAHLITSAVVKGESGHQA